MYTSLRKAQDRCRKWSRLEIPPVAKNIMPTDSFWERESQFTLKLWTLLVYHASDEGHIFKRMCSTQVELDGLKNVGRKVGWVENELGMWGEYDQNAFNEVIKELIKIKKKVTSLKRPSVGLLSREWLCELLRYSLYAFLVYFLQWHYISNPAA